MKLLRHDLTSLLLAATFLTPAVFAQDEEPEKKEPDPEIAEKLDMFREAVADKKAARDAEAVVLIDELLQKGPDYHPKDRNDILRTLRRVFSVRRRKPDQPELYAATVVSLGELGGHDAALILQRTYGSKLFDDPDWQSTRELILENIGRTKDPRMVDFLVDRATRDPSDGILRASGYALRHFEEEEFKVREEIFSRLLTEYGRITGIARSSVDPSDVTARTFKRTLSAISDGWNSTLAALSGQNFRTAEDWYTWWNDHKDKPKDWN